MAVSTSNLRSLPPSGISEAIRAMRGTGISLYVHGGPGISKSSVARQSADSFGIAFIDFRLSQIAPEDIRGVPIPGEIDGMKGVVWTPPLLFPRDLDFEGIESIDDTGVRLIRFFNPIGNNGIHYCMDPQVGVEVLTPGVNASVVIRKNSFVVSLTDADNVACSGNILWKVTGEAKAILALEEFNSAPPGVMAAAYQLILDLRIGDYVVPKGVMLLAMGNRDVDRGVTYQIPDPVANRFDHLEMIFSWPDWSEWAADHGIHPEVLGFLSKNTSKTYDYDPDTVDLAFSTPRTWEFVSKIIQCDDPPSPAVMKALICGAVGDANGNEFIQHRRFMADMPSAADILDGKVTSFSTTHTDYALQISYSVCVQLFYEMRSRMKEIERDYTGSLQDKRVFNKHPPRVEWLQQCDRAFAYAIKHFKPEVVIMTASMAISNRLSFAPTLMPSFRLFLDDNKDLLKP